MQVDFWEKRYGGEEYAYGTSPNVFFKEYLEGLVPGKLLLPAEGEGRNAVYAAKLGWEVFAFDQSEEAKVKALSLAIRNNVEIQFQVSTVENYQSETTDFDLIALTYVHIPPTIRSEFHNKLVNLLKPGGTIIVEAFNKKQIDNQSGGPKADAMLYDEATLIHDFQGLDEISFNNAAIILDEGPFHQGKADVVRMIGKAKAISSDIE